MLSADQLTISVSSARVGGRGGLDVWRAHRNNVTDAFPAPVRVDELGTPKTDYANWLSSDDCRPLQASDSGGRMQIYMASRSRSPLRAAARPPAGR